MNLTYHPKQFIICPKGYIPVEEKPGNSSCVLALEQTNKQLVCITSNLIRGRQVSKYLESRYIGGLAIYFLPWNLSAMMDNVES